MSLCDHFLDTIGLSNYKDLFNNEDLNMEILKSMTDDDLKSIGVKSFGHRYKIKEGLKVYVEPPVNTLVEIEEENSIPVDQDETIQPPEDHPDEPIYENVIFLERIAEWSQDTSYFCGFLPFWQEYC